MSLQAFRTLVPPVVRKYVRAHLNRIKATKMVRTLLQWFAGLSEAEQDKYAIEIANIRKYGLSALPYDWAYRPETGGVEVLFDGDGFPYVVRNGRNLFFPATWSKERVVDSYRWLLKEQSPESPHKYSHLGQTMVGRKALLVDVGSAEGIWAFDNASLAGEIILCEPNKQWVACLQRTFSELGCRFSIIPKMVGMGEEDGSTTLDTILKDRDGDAIAIKVDVEGHEYEVIAGADGVLRRRSRTSWDICLYHKAEDEGRVLSQFRESCTHLRSVDMNPGYMIYIEESHPKAPLLRRGVVRVLHDETP